MRGAVTGVCDRIGQPSIEGTNRNPATLRTDPLHDPSSTAYQAGRALLASGDVRAAIEQFEASIALTPHFKTLELLGEAFLRMGEPQRAIVPLAAATTLNSQVRAPSLLAEALLATGERLKAHEIAALALGRDGTNITARKVFDATLAEYHAWSSR